jgi:Rhamnogalacturonan lyase B, N-terminal
MLTTLVSITAEPSIGELRFIARLRKGAVPTGARASEIVGGSAIEGSDVFKVGSETRSKFYSSRQFIDDNIHGVTGNGIGVWMIIPPQGYESNSGGPFMRDINNQGGDQQELYYCTCLSLLCLARRPNSRAFTDMVSEHVGSQTPFRLTIWLRTLATHKQRVRWSPTLFTMTLALTLPFSYSIPHGFAWPIRSLVHFWRSAFGQHQWVTSERSGVSVN